MNGPKDEIILSLKDALSSLKIDIEPEVESSSNISFGDYSSNVALKLKINPSDIVKKIEKSKNVEKIEAKGGFINFWLSRDYLLSILDQKPIQTLNQKGKKIMVEFTDPNPFKEFHIGHLYSNIVGESISRLLESQGRIVKRVNYQGDVGLHVAKAIWGVKNSKLQIKSLETKSLKDRVKFLGKCYIKGDKAYESDEKAKKEIEELNKKIYQNDPSVKEIYEKGKKWSLDYFEEIYKRLGTHFDFYYFESEAGKKGLKLVREWLKKGVFEESEGAIIFPGEKYGLHNRVFINSRGLPTYEAKELGLAPTKYKDFPYDQSIIITGNEINEYFKVVIEALKQVNPELAAKTKHISHGMVRFPGGKISSRLGNVLLYEWLLNEVKNRIKQEFKDMTEEVAEKVTLGAIKYALLRIRIGKDIEFNIDQSISLEGDSGPYIQYSYVRTQSVLAKSSKQLLNSSNKDSQLLKEEDIIVLRALNKFGDVVEESVSNLAPSILCGYLFDLSQKFNLLYQKHQILGYPLRIKITVSVGEVLNKGLTLLGIESPKKM